MIKSDRNGASDKSNKWLKIRMVQMDEIGKNFGYWVSARLYTLTHSLAEPAEITEFFLFLCALWGLCERLNDQS